MKRYGLNLVAALIATVIATIGPARAQGSPPAWPPAVVRIVVPFAAGSTPDLVGRILADNLRTIHPGSSFIVENKPGASGNIGTNAVAKAPPDGSIIGISLGGPLAINTLLFPQLPYDPQTEIAPITLLTALPSVLVVPAGLGINSVAEFTARLKSGGAKVIYGSIGTGSLSQLCMEAIALAAGGKLVHVPYPGSPAAVTALLRGDVQSACLPAISVTPQLANGLTILAVTTPERSAFLPEVPTLKESGINVESDAWNGLIAPGGTPSAVIAQINADTRAVLAKPDVVEKLKAQLMTPYPSTPDEMRAKIANEKLLWTDVIKAADIRIN